jgi:rhodanese-related sulfurtransferase|tara:strand:- start:701 stop:1267 length:567 start_codon:yes stop_codon:yes gene_type:complete
VKFIHFILVLISFGFSQDGLNPFLKIKSLGHRDPIEDRLTLEKLNAKIKTEIEPRLRSVRNISIENFLQYPKDGQLVIVDVREKNEMLSMLPGAISLEIFEQLRQDSIYNKKVDIVFYCTIGWRSGDVANKYQDLGMSTYNLTGGVLAWAYKGGEFVNARGEKTIQVHVYNSKWNFLPSPYEAMIDGY